MSASTSSAFSKKASAIRNIAPARCSKNTSRRAGSAANPPAASTPMKSDASSPHQLTPSSPRSARKGLQVFVGVLLAGFLIQSLGLFLVLGRLVIRGEFSLLHLIHFSTAGRVLCAALPLAAAALLVRIRPYVSTEKLLGLLFYSIILSV